MLYYYLNIAYPVHLLYVHQLFDAVLPREYTLVTYYMYTSCLVLYYNVNMPCSLIICWGLHQLFDAVLLCEYTLLTYDMYTGCLML